MHFIICIVYSVLRDPKKWLKQVLQFTIIGTDPVDDSKRIGWLNNILLQSETDVQNSGNMI